MGPKVKHFYKNSTSSSAKTRRSLTLYDKDTSKESSLLQSLTSSAVRAQQEQVQKMRSHLQERERKILQDITNISKVPLPKPLKIPEIPKILPDDINEPSPLNLQFEVPSFVASPIIFKESSFNAEDSFIFFEKSKDHSKAIEFNNLDFSEDLIESPMAKMESSSPNKVPGSSDIPTSESRNIFDFDQDDNWKSYNKSAESIAAFASPISDKSISRASEIELFTIDHEFLASFEGIWHRKLERPIQVLNPESPDHFEQIPMVSRGARDRKKKKLRPNA